MKKVIFWSSLLLIVLSVLGPMLLYGLGCRQKDGEAVGQVKKVAHETPFLFPEFNSVDISMGILRNGVGSMSTQDIWFTVTDDKMEKTLKDAAESGKLVKIKYDVKRVTFYTYDHWITAVEILE